MQRSLASTNLRAWWELRNRGVLIGTDPAQHQRPVHLKLTRLATHCQVIGPTGKGKTRWLLALFRRLLHVPKACIVIINPKGSFGRLARDIVIQERQERRLEWFHPGDPDATCGYNPLHPNGLPIESHAKSVRESIRSAYGQSNFDQTRQLARMLYLSIVIARANGWGLPEALQLLRPGSRLRASAIPLIQDPQLREAFSYFHNLRGALQEELALSAIAMLEPFVTDTTSSRVLMHTPPLDLSRVIHEGRVLIWDIPLGQPLRLDDVKLWGRFLTNDLANRVFERTPQEAAEHPVYFIADEAGLFLTEDFCHLLRMGREPGISAIISHQDLAQLRAADETGNVYGSVMGSCRTKIVFGGMEPPDCRMFAEQLFLDRFNPLAVKHEIWHNEITPVESTRQVITKGSTTGGSLGIKRGISSAVAKGEQHGTSRNWGSQRSHTDAFALLDGTSEHGGMSTGETMLPNGDVIAVAHELSGTGSMHAENVMSADMYGESQAQGEHHATSITKIRGREAATDASVNHSRSETLATVPFIEQHVERAVSNRAFWQEQEVMTIFAQKIYGLPERHIIAKTDGSPAIICVTPYEPDPRMSDKQRRAALSEVFSGDHYFSPARAVQLPAPAVELRNTSSPEQPPTEFGEG